MKTNKETKMAWFTAIQDNGMEYDFRAESFRVALDFCAYKFSKEITNLICETKTRRQQFVKIDGEWHHLPYVGCAEADVVKDVNEVVLY